ncbi:MAG: tRNA (N(6)-L-threonylcarbamoyladenosine(37)-C(2))-methylthiotransferase MtaB [Ignavibacteriales bacterium]|nr:tRNA (N(6)-L-threonylcarbamoyladenosine(37)-C(2))-methylthiotransferase MtaB [Ignavibacteriales bacterium]
MMKVAFHTLGCKLNFAETSTLGKQFVERGFETVAAGQPADVVVLNTCTVTERADRECRQIIRRALRQSPDAFIIVTGCYAQLQPHEISAIEGVDLVLGSQEKFDLFKYTNGLKKKSVPQIFVSCIDEADKFHPAFSSEIGGRTRAFLKVQDGCDYTCAFCTIPLARGASRSATETEIIEQAKKIVQDGFKEIVLTGVNVGDYGKKIETNFINLLKGLERIAGLERIRISSIEPNLLTREMVDFMLASQKFCNHFHIPLQSGSENILKKMRRRYLPQDYRSIVEYISAKDLSAGIGVDVIVGFPGESDQLFEETYKFIVDLPVSYLHVFTYSERPDTDALTFADPVNHQIRHERNERLRILSQKKRRNFYSSFIGKSLPVLFEGKMQANKITGLTTNYIRVETTGDDSMVNNIENITITRIDNEICFGERDK